MLYGHSLKLPIDLLGNYQIKDYNPSSYADMLRVTMQNIKKPMTKSNVRVGYLDPRLALCTHVFVKNDSKRGLEPHYRGPYKVLERKEKYFVLQLDRKTDSVSIDRLKSAYLEPDLLSENYDDNLTYFTCNQSNPERTTSMENTSNNGQSLPSNNPNIPTGRVNKKVSYELPPVTTRYGRKIKMPQRYLS